MGSTRLPGKVLKLIMNRPMLELQIERLRRVKKVDEVIVATTVNKIDEPIRELCRKLNCRYFSGSEDNVLSRYYAAAVKFNIDCIVRINADCPLVDPSVVSKIIAFYHENSDDFDYVSNILEPGYPVGLHTEVFSFNSLERACDYSTDQAEKEHVTPYIYRRPDEFRLKNIKTYCDFSRYRWTVDYIEDFELIKSVYENLYKSNKDFDMYDVIRFLEYNSQYLKLNENILKIRRYKL